MSRINDSLLGESGFKRERGDNKYTYTKILGEGEKLVLETSLSSSNSKPIDKYSVLINNELVGQVSYIFDLYVLLKEKLGIPFELRRDLQIITNYYLESIGFEKADQGYRWKGLFSNILIEIKPYEKAFEAGIPLFYLQVNNSDKLDVDDVNLFEWFLECYGILRMIK